MVALAMMAFTAHAESEINAISPSESEINAPVEYNTIEALNMNEAKFDPDEIKPYDIYSNEENQNKTYDFGVYVCPTLYVGTNFVVGAPQYVSFNPASTHDLWLNNIVALKANPLKSKMYLTLGYGWKGNYYKMTGEKRFDMNSDNVTMVKEYPDGVSNKSSRVKTFSHTFSLLATWEVADHTNVRFGPTMSINTGKSILTKYEDPYGTIYSEKSPEIKINRITYDVMASFTYYNIGLYIKYAPQSVFKGDYGPQWSTFSLGVTAGF